MSNLNSTINDMFAEACTAQASISALQYPRPADLCKDEHWMLAVLSYYDGLSPDEQRKITVEPVGEVDPVFDGVFLVQDVTVSASL